MRKKMCEVIHEIKYNKSRQKMNNRVLTVKQKPVGIYGKVMKDGNDKKRDKDQPVSKANTHISKDPFYCRAFI
jgi:hypothetical protein